MLRQIVLLTSLSASWVVGWSETAHQVIADIAVYNLEESTKNSFIQLLELKDETELREWMRAYSIWADTLDAKDTSKGMDSAKNHFVFTNCGGPTIEIQCGGDKDDGGLCIVSGIRRHVERLLSLDATVIQRTQSLKYLVHYMGDVHQPLHVGSKSDRGGTLIDMIISPLYTETLHKMWDKFLVTSHRTKIMGHSDARSDDSRLYGETISAAIDESFRRNARSNFGILNIANGPSIEAWVEDIVRETAAEVTCPIAYGSPKLVTQSPVPQGYIPSGRTAAARQMKRAGIRLGKLLDMIVFVYAEKQEQARVKAVEEAEQRREELEEKRQLQLAHAEKSRKENMENRERLERQIAESKERAAKEREARRLAAELQLEQARAARQAKLEQEENEKRKKQQEAEEKELRRSERKRIKAENEMMKMEDMIGHKLQSVETSKIQTKDLAGARSLRQPTRLTKSSSPTKKQMPL